MLYYEIWDDGVASVLFVQMRANGAGNDTNGAAETRTNQRKSAKERNYREAEDIGIEIPGQQEVQSVQDRLSFSRSCHTL